MLVHQLAAACVIIYNSQLPIYITFIDAFHTFLSVVKFLRYNMIIFSVMTTLEKKMAKGARGLLTY